MIKEIELINFENHEHTVLKDFKNGFNLLCGNSMIGKSSIIRAIKVVCYNEFDKESIAVGEKTCTIKLTTEKGKVTVTKGENVNQWIVEPINGKKQEFNNAGRKILQEVVDITGLSVVSLGDIDLKINVMNQLDGHFLMAKIGDKDSSGSLRAQIIDEISGLLGVEPLIKSISTDALRLSKEIKATEADLQSLQKTLIDEQIITKQQEKLNLINSLYSKYEENLSFVENAKVLKNKYITTTNNINKNISKMIDFSEIDFKRFNNIENSILLKYKMLKDKQNSNKVKNLPIIEFEIFNLNDANNILTRKKSLKIIDYKKLPKIDFKGFNNIEKGILKSYLKSIEIIKNNSLKETTINDDKEIIKNEIDGLMENISVCPLTNNPISEKCKELNL